MADQLAESLRGIISGLHKTLRRSFVESRDYSLTEVETISHIYKTGKILPSELATRTKITYPSMSAILKKLEANSLIYRTPSETDGRKVYVSLSNEGMQLVSEAAHRKDEVLNQLLTSRLTPEEIRTLEQVIPILQKLNS